MVGLLAVAWSNLPQLMTFAVTKQRAAAAAALASGAGPLPPNKLLIGYDMAGGDEANGSENLAVAIRAKVVAFFLGPPVTESRAAWRQLMATLDQVRHPTPSCCHKGRVLVYRQGYRSYLSHPLPVAPLPHMHITNCNRRPTGLTSAHLGTSGLVRTEPPRPPKVLCC